ncbi:MAG: DUF2948 family protein [Alphaproteobacteria bacterium]
MTAQMASGGTPLKLRIVDAADLEVVSTLLQDALVPIGDIAWLRDERRFVMAVNRFRWESTGDERATAERVLAGVSFGGVTAVRLRDIDLGRRDAFLSLLAIAGGAEAGEPFVDIAFAGVDGGRPTIRLTVAGIDGLVEDFGEAWPTAWRPAHGEG